MSDTQSSTLAGALVALQADLPSVHKGQTAKVSGTKGSYEYRYAGLAAVSAAILPVLAAHRLAFVAAPTLNERGQFVLRFELIHAESGERLGGEYPISLPPGAPPQAVGSAITYGRRYCLTALVGLVAEDDDDGAAASHQPRAARQRRSSTQDAPTNGPTAPATETDIKRLQIRLREAGYLERDAKLGFCSAGVGRELASSKELLRGEVALLLDLLAQGAAEEHRDDSPESPA